MPQWKNIRLNSTVIRVIFVLLAIIGIVTLDQFVFPLHAQSTSRTPAFVMAHRGGQDESPENTLVGFRRNIYHGVDLEMDVRLSQDGVVMVIHDDTVDRTTDGSGAVDQMTMAELKQLDAGSWFNSDYAGVTIPTLDEVFELFVSKNPENIVMSVDAKIENSTMYNAIRTLLINHNLFDRVYIEVNTPQAAQDLNNVDSRILVSTWVSNNTTDFNNAINSTHIDRIHARPALADRAADAHAAGKVFFVGVVVESDWSSIRDYPIDGINTNRPETMLESIKSSAGNNWFTSGSGNAKKFGVHEIVLNGDGSYSQSNLFDINATVTFTAPSGRTDQIKAFYDGSDTWRAQVYISQVGNWSWSSSSSENSLDSQSGNFEAVNSPLRGKLEKHRLNSHQWQTDDGRIFLNLNDLGYILFNDDTNWVPDSTFRNFVQDSWGRGATSLRAGGCGGFRDWHVEDQTPSNPPRSNWCWANNSNKDRFNLNQFQVTNDRLKYLLNNYPDMYMQLIMFGKPQTSDWTGISQADRHLTLDYMISRWSAWPQIFFQIANDTEHTYGSHYQEHLTFYREVGNYLHQNDPWDNLRSAGSKRREYNQLTTASDLVWHNYIHQERFTQLDAEVVDYFYDNSGPCNGACDGIHLFEGEDWYEKNYSIPDFLIADPSYYYRRLFWANLISGGSTAWGGEHKEILPYDTTSYRGLHDIIHIKNFFAANNVDMSEYVADDSVTRMRAGQVVGENGNTGPSRVQSARQEYEQFLIYHPNATDGEQIINYTPGSTTAERSAEARSRLLAEPYSGRTPGVQVNLGGGASGKVYKVRWYRVTTGAYSDAGTVTGSDWVTLDAPWSGEDVVLYLSTGALSSAIPSPTPIPTIPPSGDQVLFVVGNLSLNNGDTSIRNHLQGLGYSVLTRDDDGISATAAAGTSLIVISSTVSSSTVGNTFTNVAVPIITWEGGLFDDLGMISGVQDTPADQTTIQITNAGHPLAAGFSGTVTINTIPTNYFAASPPSSATIIASLAGVPSSSTIFAYDTGDSMVGLTAPARRVGYFYWESTAASLTSDGWSLFDAAVTWAAPSAGVAGDANNDGVVDIFDLIIVGGNFGLSSGDPGYDSRADVNNSGGAIDIFDLIIVGGNFGS